MIRTKIIIVCISILLINSAVSGILYYDYSGRDTIENFESSAKDIARQSNLYISNEVNSVLARINAMCNNSYFISSLSRYLNNPSSSLYPQTMGYIADTLTEIYQGDRYITSVYMYTRFGIFETFTKTKNPEFDFLESRLYDPFREDENKNIHWFSARSSEIFLEDEEVIPMVLKFKIYNCKEDIFLVVNFSADTFKEYLRENYVSFDELYILDSAGETIVEGTRELMDISRQHIFENGSLESEICRKIEYDKEQYLTTFSKVKSNGWIICAVKSQSSLLKNMSVLKTLILTILVITGIISIFIIILMAYSITTPLRRLIKIMDKVKRGDFNVRYDYSAKNEVGELAESFNIMIEEIDKLVAQLNIHIDALKEEKRKVKQIQVKKREAELKALQAQINPHFLYNTLNTITWEAANIGAKQISTISNSLGKFFRIALSDGKEIISLKEELEHAESYLKIQKIRYDTKLSYEIDIDRELYSFSIIKLIIQPLIENAIYHGIRAGKENGMIKIYGQKKTNLLGTDVLILTVWDNGLGIDKDRLEDINEALMRGETQPDLGYGIYNVNERIRLYFGEEYGLSLESVEGSYTKAVIVIPKL